MVERMKYGSAKPTSPNLNLESGSFLNLNASMLSTQHNEGEGAATPGPGYLNNDESDYFNHNFVNSSSIVTPKNN